MKTTQTAAFLAKITQQRIHIQAGGATEWVHLPQTDSDSRHQEKRQLLPDSYLRHPVTIRELNIPKSTMCHPDMCTHMLLFPTLNFAILMYMPRIATGIKILFQIY